MASVVVNKVNIAYREYGKKSDPAVLMIMGLGAQLTMWPAELLNGIAEAGYRVIVFDNRDIGLSKKFPDVQAPNVVIQASLRRFGYKMPTSYTLADMAADAIGLLSELEIDSAHVVGVSMGGMIAQIMAAENPQRVISLTALSSTTNNPRLPSSDFRVLLAMARRRGKASTRNAAINQSLQSLKAIGTRGDDPWTNGLRERVQESYERSYYPVGATRQMAAIVDAGDLRAYTRRVECPTLVIHGTKDPLVPITGGKDIARTVKGARIEEIEGMGHDIPSQFVLRIIASMVFHFARAQNKPRPSSEANMKQNQFAAVVA